MRRYETTYILRPGLGDKIITDTIDRTNKIITDGSGSIINQEIWGLKKLAYEIKKETQGVYVYVDYAASGPIVSEMERIFRIDDNVIRYLTVKLADDIDQETIASEAERIATEAASIKEKAEKSDEEFDEDEDDSDSDDSMDEE